MKIEPLLTSEDLALLLGRPVASIRSTLSRSPGSLPPYLKLIHHIRPNPDAVRAWLASKEQANH